RFRYYQNVCTQSYSFAWWDWKRWEREIDWMALSGINLPLAFTGQEAIWQRVQYFFFVLNSLCVFKLMFFMSSVLCKKKKKFWEGWRCPFNLFFLMLSFAFPQHSILDRMRSLGMIPVLPAFAGHVPKAITRQPGKHTVRALMSSFSACCLDCAAGNQKRSQPLFFMVPIELPLKEMIKEFGTDHIYNADTFNEMTPSSSDPKYLAAVSAAVFKSMTFVDPGAVWLMQGWLFINDEVFWQPAQVKALLHGVPIGRMIILDLFAETFPVYSRTESFYGQPFIWCMLQNFGGNLGLYGSAESVNQHPFKARAFPNSTMVGTGLTPEGIEQNDVMYELMNEIGWLSQPLDLLQWASLYAQRRYGSKNADATAAWQLLFQSVYNSTYLIKNHNHNPLVKRPSLQMSTDVWYNRSYVYEAWRLMHKAAKSLNSSRTFKYDLVDVTRQAMELEVIDFYTEIKCAFQNGSLSNLLTAGGVLLYDLLPELDNLLSSDNRFLLGHWLEAARSLATNKEEADLYDFNARNQVTLWGPTGNILDYANKEWGGLINDYYTKRWYLFLTTLVMCLNSGEPYHQQKFDQDVFKVEMGFINNKKTYPSTPTGDTFAIVNRLFLKYYPKML
uniref:N-acetyl-alpha-glucosaminidase n=1 Tax=Latimeria chalumnae TaxID=7897 RepID=H3A9S5_LATCH